MSNHTSPQPQQCKPVVRVCMRVFSLVKTTQLSLITTKSDLRTLRNIHTHTVYNIHLYIHTHTTSN